MQKYILQEKYWKETQWLTGVMLGFVFFFFFYRFFSLIGYYIILSIVPWATKYVLVGYVC